VDAARRSRWKKPRNKVFAARAHDPALQLERAEHVAWLAERAAARSRRLSRLGRWIVFGIVLLALGAAFWLVAPSATVTLTPAADQIAVTVSITADPALTDIDIETARMPATVVSLEATSRVTIEASGRADAGDRPSRPPPNCPRAGECVRRDGLRTGNFNGPLRNPDRADASRRRSRRLRVSIRALDEHPGRRVSAAGAFTAFEGDLAGFWPSQPKRDDRRRVSRAEVVTARHHSRCCAGPPQSAARPATCAAPVRASSSSSGSIRLSKNGREDDLQAASAKPSTASPGLRGARPA